MESPVYTTTLYGLFLQEKSMHRTQTHIEKYGSKVLTPEHLTLVPACAGKAAQSLRDFMDGDGRRSVNFDDAISLFADLVSVMMALVVWLDIDQTALWKCQCSFNAGTLGPPRAR